MDSVSSKGSFYIQDQVAKLLESQAGSLGTKEKESLKQACIDFEAYFVKQMLDSMRKTIDRSSGLISQNMGEKIFEDMLYDKYSQTMAKEEDFGIAKMLYNQLSQKLPGEVFDL